MCQNPEHSLACLANLAIASYDGSSYHFLTLRFENTIQFSVAATVKREKASNLSGEGFMAADPPESAAAIVERIATRRVCLGLPCSIPSGNGG